MSILCPSQIIIISLEIVGGDGPGGSDTGTESGPDQPGPVSTNESETETSSSSILPRTSDSSSESDSPLDIANDKSGIPIQPKIYFPSRSFAASGNRAFQAHWYAMFPWMSTQLRRMQCSVFHVGFLVQQATMHSPVLAFVIGSTLQGSLEF